MLCRNLLVSVLVGFALGFGLHVTEASALHHRLLPDDPVGSTPVRFIVAGDTRGDSGADPVNIEVLGEIVQATLNEEADFILIPGDLVYGSADQATLVSQLTMWRDMMRPLYDSDVGVYPCRGNHDVGSKAAWDAVFSGEYVLPTNGPAGERSVTYSFAHSNVFVVALDQYGNHPHRVSQEWLNLQLRLNTLPHVFVFGHEPAFSVRNETCLDDYPSDRNVFWSSMEAEVGRTYLCGHDHLYDHARLDDGDRDYEDDHHQFVVGTGGAPLHDWSGNYDGNNGPWTTELVYHEKQYGYLLVEVDGLSATLTWKHRTAPGVYRAGGDVFSYTVPAGSCCDWSGGICADGVVAANCRGAEFTWARDVLCNDLDPLCSTAATGACCNVKHGSCADGVLEAGCRGDGLYWTADEVCADLIPPCAETAAFKVLELRADKADGVRPYPIPGNGSPWIDLTGDGPNPPVIGFAGNTSNGWLGNGTPGNPHRLAYDGADDARVEVRPGSLPEWLSGLDAYSVTMWFKTSPDAGDTPVGGDREMLMEFVQTFASPRAGCSISYVNHNLYLWTCTTWLQVVPIEGDRWYHVAVTKERNVAIRMYLDGVKVREVTTSREIDTCVMTGLDHVVTLGVGNASGTTYDCELEGAIAQVALWKGAIAERDVMAEYMAGKWLYTPCAIDDDCDDGNICTSDSCNPASACVHVANNAPCDDGNACTKNDMCSGGTCVGGPPLNCDDDVACTDDTCDFSRGCVFAANHAFCDNGLFCDGFEACRPEGPEADARGCAAGDNACEWCCNEDSDTCAGCCIVSSWPPNCAVDARYPANLGDGCKTRLGWDTVDLTFRCGPDQQASTDPSDYRVKGVGAPGILSVTPIGSARTVVVRLDGPIPVGQWTCIEHIESGSQTCLGFLPADVNGDLAATPADVLRIIDAVNQAVSPPLESWQCDIDRSQGCVPSAILAVINLLNGADCFEAWLGQTLPDCPSTP